MHKKYFSPIMQLSGKLVVSSILFIAILAAGASWWFRYNATHRAVNFWGPEAVRLIRDAPKIVFEEIQVTSMTDGEEWKIVSSADVTHAPGISHLRNALLEDRSFDWPAPNQPPDFDAKYALRFRLTASDDEDVEDRAFSIFFSSDLQWAAGVMPKEAGDRVISCQPISKGLRQMFDEFRTERGR